MNTENDIFSKLAQKAKTTKLSDLERNKLFLAVDAFVKNNPIHGGASFSKFTSSRANFSTFFSGWQIQSFRTAIAALVILVSGIGTSFASQNSLPGDILYPVRVNVNEEIKAAFLSGTARSEYEVKRAKNRIDEAKQLASREQISEEVRGEIIARLNAHVSKVQEDINNYTEKGDLKSAYEISADLEETLEHSRTLAVAEIVEGPLEASVLSRENTENKILTLNTNDENTKIIAMAKLDSVQKSIETLDARMTSLPVAPTEIPKGKSSSVSTGISDSVALSTLVNPDPVSNDLERAKELFQKGQEKLDNEEYNEAFSFFKEANDITRALENQIKIEDALLLDELNSLDFNIDNFESPNDQSNGENFDNSKTEELKATKNPGSVIDSVESFKVPQEVVELNVAPTKNTPAPKPIQKIDKKIIKKLTQ